MLVLCYKCKHSWNYKGKNSEGEGYITCPGCLYKIRIDKAMVESSSNQKLLTTIPKKEILPTRILEELPTTTNEIKPLQIKRPIYRKIIKQPKTDFIEPKKKIKEFDNISDFHLEVQKQEYVDSPIKVREIEGIKIIRTIPRDPIKLLEHQRSFF